jgi:predicted enzyme related to lactoylglutathione lyase
MITSVHTLVYSDDAPATRAFLAEVVGLPFVEDAGSGPGWLIFGTGPSEMGVHPTRSVWEGQEHVSPRHHQISLMCDDIEATRRELEAKGATFLGPVAEEGFGLVLLMEVPGADPIMVYEPRHRVAYDLR